MQVVMAGPSTVKTNRQHSQANGAGRDRGTRGEERCLRRPKELKKTCAAIKTDAKNSMRWRILVEEFHGQFPSAECSTAE